MLLEFKMTLFKCSKHGLRGIEHVCQHVYEAFENDATIKFNRVSDEFLGAIWLCSDCAKLHKRLKENDRIEEIYDLLEACCNHCFNEWQKRIEKWVTI
jgi:protein-arginine kinase activator protein McsA